jgi:DNA repair photolyase
MYCSTTDPYQVIHHPDPERQSLLTQHSRRLVRRSLELIRDHSTLNVRILTRSPLVRSDFGLFKSFGPRLLFGMSLPTLRNDLARVYEPKAPAPSQRLAALRAAREAGFAVYVAVAPTYPECDEADLRATLRAVAELEPLTVFHEPINIRAENVERIQTHANKLGVELKTDVFATRERWQNYAVNALQTVERLAGEFGLADRLHLWPDKCLGNGGVANRMSKPNEHLGWLRKWWGRISEWPTNSDYRAS